MQNEQQVRRIAYESIRTLAPDEERLFDLLWAEAMEDPDLLAPDAGKHDRHLGAGSTAEVSLMSLVVIPIVVSLAKDLGVYTVKQIVEYVKKRLAEGREQQGSAHLSDEEIARIAEVIAERSRARQ